MGFEIDFFNVFTINNPLPPPVPPPSQLPTAPPVSGPPPLSIATFYYPWYGPNRHWREGYLRNVLSPVQQPPLLGEYNNHDMSLVNQHVQWANAYEIHEFITSWWGPNSYSDIATKDYIFQSPYLGNLKIALFYETVGRLQWDQRNFDQNAQDILIADVRYIATTYFDHPNYLRIHNKPVLYIYLTRSFGGNYIDAINNLRSTILQEFGYELFLVGDEVFWGAPNPTRIGILDAITAYNMHGPSQYNGYSDDTNFLNDVQSKYEEYKNVASSLGVHFIPGVIPGFNDRAVRLDADHYAIPREVNAALVAAGGHTTLRNYLSVSYNTIDENIKTIVITSFNEWHEDTNIEPTILSNPTTSTDPSLYTQGYTYIAYNFELLDIIKTFKDTHY